MNIVTHNSRFHADDVFAAAALRRLFPEAKLIRSRDEAVITSADIVFDVGNVYDPVLKRFDHHQKGGAGVRDNDIPYASFGLVWKHFGEQICGSLAIAEAVDKNLVQSIDAMDNGMELAQNRFENGPFSYTIQSIVSAFNPTWKENVDEADEAFALVSAFAEKILLREIQRAEDGLEASVFVHKAYDDAKDKRIIVLDDNYPWHNTLLQFPEPLYVVRPNVQSSDWKVEAVNKRPMNYEIRKKLPSPWAGKRDSDLADVSGVSDATFCHNGRFLAVAKSKAGALKLAELAADAVESD